MDRVQFATDAPLDYKPIWDMKAAVRRAEVERQLCDATLNTDVYDVETEEAVVKLTWTTSRFSTARVDQYVAHGISDPLDGNGKESLVLSVPGDPDAKWLTLGLHMVGRIEPVKEV